MVRSREYALLLYDGGKHRALYNLKDDPRQRRNVIKDQPERAADLAGAFLEFARSQTHEPVEFLGLAAEPQAAPAARQAPMSEDLRRELRALGYLE